MSWRLYHPDSERWVAGVVEPLRCVRCDVDVRLLREAQPDGGAKYYLLDFGGSPRCQPSLEDHVLTGVVPADQERFRYGGNGWI